MKFDPNTKNPNIILKLVISIVLFFFGLICLFMLFENLDADRIMVVQSPVRGSLTWHVTPGIKWQGFGRVTKYYKLDTYEFQIPVRFNDGGHGTIQGSINYELPFDNKNLNSLHMKYGSQEAIQKQLIETVTNKCVYMTGPLMSSKESYAEKRTSLIRYIEDQINYGVFRTTQKEMKTTDAMTGQEKTVTVVEIVLAADGVTPLRQEEAILSSYGIKTSNFAVTSLPYDEKVEGQIKQQQEISMKVQTAMASAKEAEQNVITVAKQGEANAATAKWQQEVEKAKAVTLAEQQKEVAKLERDAAEFTKQKEILLGQGEAERKKLAMSADGALKQKLDAWLKAQEYWADAAAKYQGQWVPTTVIGGEGKDYNGAQTFMDLMGMKAAKDLSLDMSIKGK